MYAVYSKRCWNIVSTVWRNFHSFFFTPSEQVLDSKVSIAYLPVPNFEFGQNDVLEKEKVQSVDPDVYDNRSFHKKDGHYNLNRTYIKNIKFLVKNTTILIDLILKTQDKVIQ